MNLDTGANGGRVDQVTTLYEEALGAILLAYGFDGWGLRQNGRRLRCPHGLLIGLTEECPVGCISPLVVIGVLDLDE